MISDNPRLICEAVEAAIPSLIHGSLRIWGQWFGRPYDNVHRLVSCTATADQLRLVFNEDEVLTVWSPAGVVLGSKQFEILDASRVRWEWYSYGEPKAKEHLLHEDYTKQGQRAALVSNVHWYTPPSDVLISGPAVELL